MQFITILDYILLPTYLLLILVFANQFRNRHYPPGHPWRKYFLPGLGLKLFGAILIGMIYQYNYGGGDTAAYYFQSLVVDEAIMTDPFNGFKLLLHIPDMYSTDYQQYISRMEWYFGANMYIVIALAAFFNLFTFSSFIATSMLFAVLSFTGVWALFRTFAQQYPEYLRQVAIAVMFIPSCYVWSSGIFKDTLCMFGMGWLIYCVFQLLVQKNFSFSNIFLLMMSFILVAIVKVYIILALGPSIFMWLTFVYTNGIKNTAYRAFAKISLLLISVSAVYLLLQFFEDKLGSYALDNIAKTAETTRLYVLEQSEIYHGSGYDLGTIDGSAKGFIRVFPKALTIALYGPFIWEARKVIVLMSSLEAMIFLYLSLKLLFVVGPRTIVRTISRDPNIQFFVVFTIIFGFAVGLVSGNYGSLSRYRVPCLPLFGMAIVLIYYRSGKATKPLSSFLKI
ncbi:hypothetical protein [Rurimicrobium arvi]|uniref:Glycosyltransferase RgtA/B/C/D-like domain-containing protein n=1 Tax=Rurimicrobium arvi TaxID=2049916 RepID=A0ABP8MS93_9BACT